MHDDSETLLASAPRIDARVLRHMMMETVDLLEVSTSHAEEACESTDAAMALTRIDWMLMAIFNWLTRQLRTDRDDDGQPLGKPVSIIGINYDAVSEDLREYARAVDRLHARAEQLESLITATVRTQAQEQCRTSRPSGQVLHIFGDPNPSEPVHNEVLSTRARLNSALGGH